MSKQDIEKRLGFAAQGVKETTRTSAKAKFVRFMDLETWKNSKGTVFTAGIEDDAGRFQPYVTARDSSGGDQLQTRSAPTFKTEQGARKWLNTWLQNNKSTSSRPGAKAEMGFLSRVGYAATALTADPADPKSPEYRKQVSEAKAAAKDAITNYKFMRDKVKERLAALDAYVTNAIKVINSATSAKDIEHYVEQLRIAVKSQSMILGASKSPFSRAGGKAKMALTISTVGAKNLCYEALANLGELAKLASDTKSGWGFHVTVMTDHVKSAMSKLESSPAQAGEYLERAIDTLGMLRKIDPVRLNDIQKGSLKQLIGYVAKSLRDARANIKVVTTASRPGAKAKFDTKVGSKGNKSAMIARNGADADASWLAWVVQHHGEGQGESVLGTMRSYSTEARAKAAALRGLETSGLRGGFSRPGAKAKA